MSRLARHLTVVSVFAAACGCLASQPADGQGRRAERETQFRQQIQPLLDQYCSDCHANGASEGDLALDQFKSAQQMLEGRDTWLKVLQKVRVNAMPPEDSEQPSESDRKLLIESIDDAINNIDCVSEASPGRVTLRRLNRIEYRNTIRDLIGVDYAPAADFPADDVGYGFDNIGDVLSLPPILMEKYLDAAEAISDQAIVTSSSGPGAILEKRGVGLSRAPGSHEFEGDGLILTTTGTVEASANVEDAGRYLVQIDAFGQQAGKDPVRMSLIIDGKTVMTFSIKSNKPKMFEHEVRVGKGKRVVGVSFLNDFYKPKTAKRAAQDRNLIIRSLAVRGPLDKKQEMPASHRRVFFVEPGEKLSEQKAARQILERLASRAYRRPATESEVERLVRMAMSVRDEDENFAQGIQLALQAILVSPHFLFRIERDPSGGQKERLLSDYELATRLSYFLWSTTPDDELFRHAWNGTLRKGDNLERQVRRMLQDRKSYALVENFASQWLNLRKFDGVEPSIRHYPAFTNRLRDDMRTETLTFVAHVMRKDRSVLELLSADYSFLNERLARHYGVGGVRGDQFRQASLANSPRGGLLTHGSILTVTSNPTRTSPVKRGKWILENLLGEPPPPPPPDVPDLEEERDQPLTGSLRERLEQHRANPSCAVCHQQMDELGFALENFDAIGAWRAFDGRYEINAKGELPSGERFNGPRELAKVLRTAKKDQFVRCLTEKLLTFGLGRGLEYYDRCATDKIVKVLRENDYRFSALVLEIVRSDPFQKRAAKSDG